MIAAVSILAVASALVAAGLLVRWRAFRHFLRYDPGQSYRYSLERLGGVPVKVTPEHDGLALQTPDSNAWTCLLPVEITTTLTGRFCDPWIESTSAGVTRRQYFERGTRGTRYLNLGALFASRVRSETRVQLRGGHLRWRVVEPSVAFAFDDRVEESDRVLVVAPHPDDAEILAFGIYCSTDATIVTVTAGQQASQFGSGTFGELRVPPAQVARIRLLDSISVPQIGKVPRERAINLAYPDGCLAAMHAAPDRDFDAGHGDGARFAELRAMNSSRLVSPERMACSWRSLVTDLTRILEDVKPNVIVTPFPGQDPHPDHIYSTAAVTQALCASGLHGVRVMLGVVHNRWTELYPFGPAGSDVTLPPLFDANEIECDGLCVAPLSIDQQTAKHLAVEAMHDIRPVLSSSSVGWREVVRRMRSTIHAAIHGLGLPPTSYLRRAVRPQELFFMVRAERLSRLVETAISR